MKIETSNVHIHCIGLNHRTADLTVREKIAFQEDSIKAALARSGCGLERNGQVCSEMVILSTCNRVEIYAVRSDTAVEPLKSFLAELKDLAPEDYEDSLYHFMDDAAVEHLFKVTSGLELAGSGRTANSRSGDECV